MWKTGQRFKLWKLHKNVEMVVNILWIEFGVKMVEFDKNATSDSSKIKFPEFINYGSFVIFLWFLIQNWFFRAFRFLVIFSRVICHPYTFEFDLDSSIRKDETLTYWNIGSIYIFIGVFYVTTFSSFKWHRCHFCHMFQFEFRRSCDI